LINNLIIFSFIILLWQVELVEQVEAVQLVNLVELAEAVELVNLVEQAEVVACGVE
jgi:hypothetical protein